jgi:hypothetical protein
VPNNLRKEQQQIAAKTPTTRMAAAAASGGGERAVKSPTEERRDDARSLQKDTRYCVWFSTLKCCRDFRENTAYGRIAGLCINLTNKYSE